MECLLLSPDANQMAHSLQHPGLRAVGIVQQLRELIVFPDAPVDRAVSTGSGQPLIVVRRTQQTLNVDAGNTFQSKDNGMRADEAIDLILVTPVFRTRQRIYQADIHFVGACRTVRPRTHGNLAAEAGQCFEQSCLLAFRQQTVGRPHANAIMRRDEVEVGRTTASRRHAHHPGLQVTAIAGQQGVYQ